MDARGEVAPLSDLSDLPHLSDEEFTGLLLGAIPPGVIAHLEGCGQCRLEAERFSGAIGSFAQQSRVWAERRAATLPGPALARPLAVSWLGLPAGTVAWSGAALALVLAAGVGLAHRSGQSGQTAAVRQPGIAQEQSPVEAPVQAATVSAATLKADNELLSAIDGKLSGGDTPSASDYGLTAGRHAARVRSVRGISN